MDQFSLGQGAGADHPGGGGLGVAEAGRPDQLGQGGVIQLLAGVKGKAEHLLLGDLEQGLLPALQKDQEPAADVFGGLQPGDPGHQPSKSSADTSMESAGSTSSISSAALAAVLEGLPISL